jgi:hypothetical protein
MRFRKIQQLAQAIGFLVIAGLALYGLVTVGSGQLWAAGDESRPAVADAPQIIIPSTFNYQGFLRDGQGNPMGGSHAIKVSLWTDVTGGTSPLYDETFSNVSVRDGLFNVVMGSTKTMSPSYFQNVSPIFVGVSVDGGDELLPRQRIHPVPWALLSTSAQEATTLVNGASVDNVKLNGTTKVGGATVLPRAPDGIEFQGADFMVANAGAARFYVDNAGARIYKNATVDGNVTIGGSITTGIKPILIKRYQDVAVHNTNFDLGISAADYACTIGGWAVNMDVNEIGYALWSRSTYTSGGTWHIQFYDKVHGQTPNPPVSFDVICFRYDITEWQNGSAVVAASALADPAAAGPLPNSSSDEVGQ